MQQRWYREYRAYPGKTEARASSFLKPRCQSERPQHTQRCDHAEASEDREDHHRYGHRDLTRVVPTRELCCSSDREAAEHRYQTGEECGSPNSRLIRRLLGLTSPAASLLFALSCRPAFHETIAAAISRGDVIRRRRCTERQNLRTLFAMRVGSCHGQPLSGNLRFCVDHPNQLPSFDSVDRDPKVRQTRQRSSGNDRIMLTRRS